MGEDILPDGKIKGTRTTIYYIMDFLLQGMNAEQIAAHIPISVEKIQIGLDYIAAHRAEVDAVYKKIIDRCERGNPPEIQARLERSMQKAIQFREELRARATHRV